MDKEAAVLIIKNIGMLEDASRLVNEIYALIAEKVCEELEGLASKNGFEYTDDPWVGIGLSDWRVGDDKKFLAWVNWNGINEDGRWELTQFLSERSARYGFRFEVQYGNLPSASKRLWKNFARLTNDKYPKLQELGFEFDADSGTWFIPWKISAGQVAEDLRTDNFDASLKPIRESFAKVKEAQPFFEKIVEEARQQFSGEQQQ